MIVPTVACTTLVAWQAVAAQPCAVAGATETSVPSRLNTATPQSLANELSGRTRRADTVFTPGCGFSAAFCGLVKQGPCLVRSLRNSLCDNVLLSSTCQLSRGRCVKQSDSRRGEACYPRCRADLRGGLGASRKRTVIKGAVSGRLGRSLRTGALGGDLPHHPLQRGEVERLRHGGRADLLKQGGRVRGEGVARAEDEARHELRALAAQPLDELAARHPRHADVGDDHVEVALLENAQRIG